MHDTEISGCIEANNMCCYWVRQKAAALQAEGSSPAFGNLGSEVGITRVTQAPPDLEFVVSSVVPPAAEIARRVLSACEHEGMHLLEEAEPMQQELQKAWSEMHYLRTPSHAGPFVPLSGEKKSLATVTLCQRVGFCCCGPAMAQRRRFRSTLSSLLKIFFKKGSAGRKLYDRALAVLRVFSDHSDSAFYVVGFGNLTDADFTVKPMKQVRKGFDPFCF